MEPNSNAIDFAQGKMEGRGGARGGGGDPKVNLDPDAQSEVVEEGIAVVALKVWGGVHVDAEQGLLDEQLPSQAHGHVPPGAVCGPRLRLGQAGVQCAHVRREVAEGYQPTSQKPSPQTPSGNRSVSQIYGHPPPLSLPSALHPLDSAAVPLCSPA